MHATRNCGARIQHACSAHAHARYHEWMPFNVRTIFQPTKSSACLDAVLSSPGLLLLLLNWRARGSLGMRLESRVLPPAAAHCFEPPLGHGYLGLLSLRLLSPMPEGLSNPVQLLSIAAIAVDVDVELGHNRAFLATLALFTWCSWRWLLHPLSTTSQLLTALRGFLALGLPGTCWWRWDWCRRWCGLRPHRLVLFVIVAWNVDISIFISK